MEYIYLIVGFVTVILFNTLGLLISRNRLFPQSPVIVLNKRLRRILIGIVVFFQFLGVALISIGFLLILDIAKTPAEALGFLKEALFFVVPVLLLGYFILRKRAHRIDADQSPKPPHPPAPSPGR